MKLKDILTEAREFSLYQGLMRVRHTDENTASQVADFIRAMPGVTRVTAIDSNEDTNIVVLKVKILSPWHLKSPLHMIAIPQQKRLHKKFLAILNSG